MNHIDFSNLGGMPFTQNRADFLQQSYLAAFGAIARLCGDKAILYGVVNTGGSVSDGWISYNGELLPFIGGVYAADVVITETTTPFTFADSSTHDVEFTRYASCGASGAFLFADLLPILSLTNIWLPGDIKQKVVDSTYETANFDGSGYGTGREAGWRKLSAVYTDAAGAVLVNKKAGDTEFGVVGNFGGEKNHTLIIGEMPAHNHAVAEYSGNVTGGNHINAPLNTGPQGTATGSTGGGGAHNNLQPYFVVLTLIKL